jgi:hypothetical protein
MSLSLEGKEPIARVVDLDIDDSYFVYINPLRTCVMEKRYPPPTPQIIEAVREGADLDELLEEMYPDIVEEEVEEEGCKLFGAKGNKLINVMPSPRSENILIAGKKGLGKSVWASMYAKEYKTMFPENEVYLFCRSANDPAFDEMGVEINSKVINSEADLITDVMEDFEDSLVIFDDMDNLPSKQQRVKITALMSDIMANGRKLNIYCMYLTHILFNKDQTKGPINECDKFVFFIAGNVKHNRKFLKENVGMENFEIDRILNMRTRWVCLNLTPPKYMVTQKEIMLL